MGGFPGTIFVAAADDPGVFTGNGIAVADDGHGQMRCGGFDPVQLAPHAANLQGHTQTVVTAVGAACDNPMFVFLRLFGLGNQFDVAVVQQRLTEHGQIH